jgi:S1-C subfamily serine protease
MSALLQSLSNDLAQAVASAGGAVVAIHARRRIPASGVHWRAGVIVATHHTIRRDDEITVTLPDGAKVPATLAGRDPSTDLAVLKVTAPGLATATIHDGLPSVGQLVLALGRPGPGLTASWGVVSSVAGAWRTWQGGELDALVRLDVAIYDGFSGGPLVDAEGRVLGINSSALARGLGLAIPVATVERVVAELLERGAIRRAYLGIGMQPVRVPQSLGAKLNLATDVALLVVSLESGGPADRAGLLLGDVLLELDGVAVSDPGDVLAHLGRDRIGQAVATRLIRGGEAQTVQVTVGERPRSRAA